MTQLNSQLAVTSLTPTETLAGMKTGELVLVDVRTELEYAGVHATGAVHHPIDALDVKSIMVKYPGKTICCICKGGTRGGKAAEQFAAAGCRSIANVSGGTEAWIASGLPVDRRNVISLERQVRIVAGLIVLAGAMLAWLVHPYFIGVCAFVGAGLAFAGITDFCGMGLLIAKMPWNKNLTSKSCGGSSCVVS